MDFHNSEPLLVSVTDKDAGIRLYNIEKVRERKESEVKSNGRGGARFFGQSCWFA